jgi:hypothetical protein
MQEAISATVVAISRKGDGLIGGRRGLVRIPAGADTSLFAGWGVRI